MGRRECIGDTFFDEMYLLQQKSKDFHEKIKSTLEKVLEQCQRDSLHEMHFRVTPLCKKPIQKCPFISASDTDSLCAPAYWLYGYGYKEPALEICGHTQGTPLSSDFKRSGNRSMQRQILKNGIALRAVQYDWKSRNLGLYTGLNQNWAKTEETVMEYVNELKE